ncbi:hypothetical protein [Flavobacterium sp. CS20]|uniref:hypothetical protein n=1 Tax=Flavobacterium sp. CS20 TaxID=2775246 RepID=UPI001FFD991A|nr:hypothetical protein [Flavobacterium sp. CS20]
MAITGRLSFGLKQEFQTYQFLQKQLKACDKQIDQFIKKHLDTNPELKKLKTNPKPYKRENKNAPKIKDFNQVAYQYFEGVDLLAIEGVSHATILSIIPR